MCEAKRGPSLLTVAGVIAGAAAGVVALKFAESLAEAFFWTVMAACAVSAAVLVRVLRPVRAAVRTGPAVVRGRVPAALPAPPRAIEAPGVVSGRIVSGAVPRPAGARTAAGTGWRA